MSGEARNARGGGTGAKPLRKILADCRKRGVSDPVVRCHVHRTEIRYSELSAIGKLCLEEGLDADADHECLLKPERSAPAPPNRALATKPKGETE